MSDEIRDAIPIGPEDDERRRFAWDLMKTSNDVVVGFAKLMSTTSLTAIGVLLALAGFAELGAGDERWELLLVGVSCVAYLASALVFSLVVRGQRIDIGPDDYDDVVEQFLSAARLRQRMTNVGLCMLAIATSCGLAAILGALMERA